MDLTRVPVNIFVLGDLVLDHFIPVTNKERPFQRVGEEQVFQGHPRRTIPGGAANGARLIASLGRGRICLWGLSGYSPWGSFINLLERSHKTSRPDRGVIYYGSHNESHKMNTITRIVRIDSENIRHRELRIDDISYFPTTKSQEKDAMAYLKAEREHGIHAILLNDLDMRALTPSLVSEIGRFAQANRIPLFVDPKREWQKYHRIPVTCVMPNLAEWCHIVDDPEHEKTWRHEIAQGQLKRLAVKSLRHMPNADFHLIKCEGLGVVLISRAGISIREVRHIGAHPSRLPRLPGQLGPGDMLAAALAMEFAALTHSSSPEQRMLTALEKALAVVACYLEMDWQEVPSEREVKGFDVQPLNILQSTTIHESVLLLPKQDVIALRDFAVPDSHLVSTDKNYHSKIEEVVKFLSEEWDATDPRSAIVTGRGGVGKTQLIGIVSRRLAPMGILIWEKLNLSTFQDSVALIKYAEAKASENQGPINGVLVVIDEAFSKARHLLLGDQGKNLLQDCARCVPKVRFLLLDADLERYRSQLSVSQFLSRTKEFMVPELSTRHADIPYIFGSGCLRYLKSSPAVRTSEAVLLGVINWVLKLSPGEQSARNIMSKASEIIDDFKKNPVSNGSIPEISKRHLPPDLRDGLEEAESPREFFQFSW